MPRLFWRLFFTLWITVVIFAGLMGAVSDKLARQARETDTAPAAGQIAEERMRQHLRRVKQALKEHGPERVATELKRQPARNRSWIYIVDDEGQELLGRDRAITRLKAASRQERVFRDRVVAKNGREYRLFLAPRLGARALTAQTPAGTLIRLAIAALFSAIVSFVLARSLASPLDQMRRTSRQLADGDLAARSGLNLTRRKDEIGLLARDFDRMAEQLQLLDRARRRLLQDVSHELRSPLARLQVALELARGKTSREEQASSLQPELDRIALESERLNELIGEVLRLLKNTTANQPLEREHIDISQLLADLVAEVNYEAGDAAGVELLTAEPAPFEGSPELIRRALENILRNALKYSHSDKAVELNLGGTEAGWLITVRDHGAGVPESALSHLFEPFYRVSEARDRASGGHGLGLAIAVAAIERHGGSIKAANHPDGGLVVSITLPDTRQ